MARTTKAPLHEKLTVEEVCAELRISPNTFYDWRRKGRAPKCTRLPNGSLLVTRTDLDSWFEALSEDAA